MSVESRIRSGLLSRAAWYLAHGYDYQYFFDSFGALGPGESAQTMRNVWEQGRRAYNAGMEAGNYFLAGNVASADIPGYYSGRTGYRYVVIYTYRDPSGDTHPGVTHTITSATQWTLEQLEEEGRELAPALANLARRTPPLPGDEVRAELESTNVISLERW